MDILITKHAQDRIKERCGFNRKAAQRMTNKIYQKGTRLTLNLTGQLGNWALSRSQRYPNSDIALYGDKAWIYSAHYTEGITALVTVIQIPTPLQRKVNSLLNK